MRVIVHHGKRTPLSISVEVHINTAINPAWIFDLDESTPAEEFLSIINQLPAMLREAYDDGLAGEGFVLEQYDDSGERG